MFYLFIYFSSQDIFSYISPNFKCESFFKHEDQRIKHEHETCQILANTKKKDTDLGDLISCHHKLNI